MSLHIAETPAPPGAKARWISIGTAALAFAGGIVLFALFGGSGQGTREFHLAAPTSIERAELARTLRQQHAELLISGVGANSETDGWQEDVLQVTAAIQNFIAVNERLPRRLDDLGLAPEDVATGIRVVSGQTEWRLYGPNGHLLARGN